MPYDLNNDFAQTMFRCYDCGGTWDSDGIEVIKNKDVIRYVCKECRGRCLPVDELGKIKGVKSIKVRYNTNWVPFAIVFFALIIFFFSKFYERRVNVNDYKNYLVEGAPIRKSINSRLEQFAKDNSIALYSKNKKEISLAKQRLLETKKYILSFSYQVSDLTKPEKEEILELYELETKFWLNPTYRNYLNYIGTFKVLEKEYGSDFFEIIKDKVREHVESSVRSKKNND